MRIPQFWVFLAALTFAGLTSGAERESRWKDDRLVCASCHQQIVDSFRPTPHGVSLARTAIYTANPNLIVANQTLNAQAYTFPKVKNQFQELRLDSSHAISKHVRLGVMYRFEPYRISDFANDVISSYNPGAIAPENDARRYFFLDSGPGNYTGNLAAVYLRYSFF